MNDNKHIHHMVKCGQCGNYFNASFLDQAVEHMHKPGFVLTDIIKGDEVQPGVYKSRTKIPEPVRAVMEKEEVIAHRNIVIKTKEEVEAFLMKIFNINRVEYILKAVNCTTIIKPAYVTFPLTGFREGRQVTINIIPGSVAAYNVESGHFEYIEYMNEENQKIRFSVINPKIYCTQ